MSQLSPSDITSVEVGLINKCVLNCRLCLRVEDVAQQLPPDVAVDYDALVRFLDKLPNLVQLDLVGSISEPTLHKRVHDIVRYAKNRGICIRFSTNGNTFSNKWWAAFAELFDERDIIRFAVDGSTQEIHSKYRVGGKLSKVLSNHREFKKNTSAVTVLQNILFDYNINDQDNILDLFMKEGFDICEFTHTGDAMYSETPELIHDHIVPVPDLLELYNKRNISSKETINRGVICKSLAETQLYINHMGCVLPCDDMEETTFVNRDDNVTIYTHSVDECFSHVNNIIRQRFINKTCESCCGPLNRQIRKQYPIIQYNRNKKRAILHKFREIMELAS